ncbi:CPBP family intramembrane metalloprotease [Nibribacter ruber]|uniref:CPBP family intramembrane metalloprotease n=1 Tax=Nibribacter ruber TaxID=2698458 RepID=A0A6P1P244_9BACT|nr:CPBP family intramembrane glutamic endopeptidase [Nibribacter ruber]QHL88467.1 CPBP family intramembrane metalloprotease [Nibribacter ruber]
MNKLFLFLESTPQSKAWVLLGVIFSMAFIPLLANLVFEVEAWKGLLENQGYLLGWGLIVYLLWTALLLFFKRKDSLQWSHLSLQKAEIKKGLIWGCAAYLIVQAVLWLKLVSSGQSLTLTTHFSSFEGFSKAIGIFVFNIIIGAFLEEVLNRAYLLPQFYLLLKKVVKFKPIALLLALVITQLAFAVSHLPRDLFRYDVTSLDALLSTQGNLFWSGIIYAVLYLRTRNILFVSIFHALANFQLAVLASDVSMLLYNSIAFYMMALIWRKPKETLEPAWV